MNAVLVAEIGFDELEPLSPEEEAEALEAAKMERLGRLRDLVRRLSAKRDESIRAKRPIEQMMLNSIRLYDGLDRILEPTKAQSTSTDTDRQPTPHLIRARTDRWQARMCDMMSTNPWDLEPEDGTDMTAADGMKKLVEDQLSWCRFERTKRRLCRDAARLGTGLSGGPRNTIRKKRTYQAPQPALQTGWQQDGFVPVAPPAASSMMVTEESLIPNVEELDPFMFFPDMVDRVEKAEHAHYGYIMGKLEISNLSPKFDQDQINALLRSPPDMGELRYNLAQRSLYLGNSDPIKDKYVIWRFTGLLEKDDLELLGLCECEADEEIDDEGNTTAPPMLMGEVWYSQEFILFSKLSPVPDDFRIPYQVFSPFTIDGSMFGMSLPMLGEDSQRVAKAAWGIALLNAARSSGPVTIMRAGKLKPADGEWAFRGPKVMLLSDENTQIDDAYKDFLTPNNVAEALTIFDRAMSIMDEELNTSQWASPEGAEETDTASGLAMIMNARSILQLMVAAAMDDDIFEPLITRMCWWNNDNPDCPPEIKGNFIVKPVVQSQRLVKDVQAQQATVFAGIIEKPQFAKYSKPYKTLKYLASFIEGPADELVMTESEAAEVDANPQPDPVQELAMLKAQTEQAKAETERIKAETAKIEQERELMEMQFAMQMQGQDPNGEGALQASAELALKQRALDLQEQKIASQEEIALMRQQAQEQMAAVRLQEARLKAREFAYEKQQDRQSRAMIAGMNLETTAQEIAVKNRFGTGI